jgi:hypothetical protein
MVFKSDAGRYNLRLELGNEMGESTYMDNIVVTPIRVQLSAKIPDPQDGIIFIVPKDIASLYIASGRQDLLFPDYPDAYDLPPDKYPTYRGLYKFE